MASLGSLVVHLAADTARFQGDLGRAAAIAESRMRNIKDTASRALGALTVAASAAGAALVVSLKAATDRADDLRDLAAGAGVTVEAFSRLQFAASQSGVETETLAKALAKLSKGGSGDPAADLSRLADQFAKLPDGATKTARAIELFGEKLGPKLIPLLNEGSEGLKKMAELSDRLGATVSGKTAAAADQFNDSLGLLSLAGKGFANQLITQLLPLMNTLIERFVTGASASENLGRAVTIAATGFKLMATVGQIVVTIFETVGSTIGAVAAALVQVAQGNFSEAAGIIKERWTDTQAGFQAAATNILDIWDDTGNAIASGAPALAKAMTGPLEMTSEQLKKIAKEREEMNETTRVLSNTGYADSLNEGLFDPLIQSARNVQVEISGGLVPTVEAAADDISAFADQAARNMQDAFANFLFDPFQGGLKGMLKGFVDVIRRMIAEAAAAKIFSAFSSGSKGGAGGFFGSVLGGLFGGGKAIGGPVSAGTSYLVGERGPELFTPGRAGTITPNDKLARGGPVINFNPTYNIAAGVSRQELLPALASTQRQTITEITRLIQGGAFAG